MNRRTLSIFCAGLGLTLLSMAAVPFAFAQAEATSPAPEATEAAAAPAQPISAVYDLSQPAKTPSGDNSYCAMCHNVTWRSVTLDDGYSLNLYVPTEMLTASVHGRGETPLGCVDCHGEDAFPHNEARPTAYRPYAIEANQMCVGCHTEHASDAAQGLHAQAISNGNASAAVCTDCHGAHDVQRVASHPQLVAGVCADCHTDTYDQWRTSAHVDIGPLGCSSCHSPHSQQIRVEQGDANGLCLNCHKDMPDQWIHSSHAAYEPSIECVACHMDAQALPGSAQRVALSGEGLNHSMIVTTTTCTTCHEQAPIVAEGAAEATREPSAVAEAAPEGAADEAHAEDTQPGSFVQLLQGLILGLGLGATTAVVFVARGNRSS